MAERDNLTSANQGQVQSSGAERSADEIRQDIAARREHISETVDRLSDRFQRTFDWRAYVSDYPLVALGAAAGLGLLASRMLRRRSTPGERMRQAFADSFEDLTDRFRHGLDEIAPHKSGFGLSRTVKAAATGMITKAVTDYLRNRFAGDYEQYHEYVAGYAGAYPMGEAEYPESETDDWPGVKSSKKSGSEPHH
ncbi:MAG: hypothetical protein JMDDDDMK_05109 [Acidobacteria bacterium]|nr:hypothetical protein [Acidobacteriota bacterium]